MKPASREIGMLEHKLKPLRRFLADTDVSEIQANEPGLIWVEKAGAKPTQHRVADLSLEWWQSLGRLMANGLSVRDFERTPYLAATLPGGHRIQLCLGNSVATGLSASIRIAKFNTHSLDDFEISSEHRNALTSAIDSKANVLISGGTYSGKTSLMNAAVRLMPADNRVLSVEDTYEIDLSHIPNAARHLVSRLATDEDVTYKTVIDAFTRLRPDRILVGELSTQNTWILLRLLNTGHGGLLTTVHANSPELALEAAAYNILLGPQSIASRDAIIPFLRQTIDLVVQVRYLPGQTRRRVTELLHLNDAIPPLPVLAES